MNRVLTVACMLQHHSDRSEAEHTRAQNMPRGNFMAALRADTETERWRERLAPALAAHYAATPWPELAANAEPIPPDAMRVK